MIKIVSIAGAVLMAGAVALSAAPASAATAGPGIGTDCRCPHMWGRISGQRPY